MKDHSLCLRKPYVAPLVRREAPVALVTAGSFDLLIPNA